MITQGTSIPVRVSVIVCTRNRGSRLSDFFARLLTLESPPGGWELVLIDNGSTDETARVIDAFARRAPFPVQHLYEPVPGPSRARNLGIARANGDILAFTDDDCYPAPGYLRALVQVFDEGPHGFVGGRIVLHDPTDAMMCVKDLPEAFDIPARTFITAGLLHGANLAMRREVVRAIGGYDTMLGPGTPCIAAEDVDLVARAVWAGWSGRYDPRPVVAHHHGRKAGSEEARHRRGYDYGRGAYYMKRVLDRRSRRAYLVGWYKESCRNFRAGRGGWVYREILGGALYAFLRLRNVLVDWLRPGSGRPGAIEPSGELRSAQVHANPQSVQRSPSATPAPAGARAAEPS